jgi:hypothetical protein
MSKLTERIKEHYESTRELKGPIEVDEWGEDGEPLEIYWRPMNLAQEDKIYNWINQGSVKSLIQTLITRALDAEGKPLFRQAEMKELYVHGDPEVIGRVCREMAPDREEDVTGEERVKK